jgi:hypothetical protein
LNRTSSQALTEFPRAPVTRARSQLAATDSRCDPLAASILGLQRSVGNSAVGRYLAAQRSPVMNQSPPLLDSLTGEPVPGYEQPRLRYDDADVKEFWNQLGIREKENKKNAAGFIGGYGGAIVSLWGRHVSEVMAEAGKSAGWGSFDKLLNFVAIKVLETVAATVLTPGSVAIFEAFGKEVTERVAEIGIHAISGYAGEHAAEALQDNAKEGQIEIAQEDIDKVTAIISTNLKKVTVESIDALPDITPYAKWLSEADKTKSSKQLSKFRLPALFPKINERDIYGIAAGVITGILEGAGSPRPRRMADHDSYITVDGPRFDQVEFHSPFKDLKIAASKVPISSLPTVPIWMTIPYSVVEEVRPNAIRLMGRLRPSGFATNAEVDEFIKASGETEIGPGGTGYIMIVERLANGQITVASGSLGQRLYLYQWATSDWDLTGIANQILDLVPSQSDEVPGENSSWLATPTELLEATRKLLSAQIITEGGRLLIKERVEKLYPRAILGG